MTPSWKVKRETQIYDSALFNSSLFKRILRHYYWKAHDEINRSVSRQINHTVVFNIYKSLEEME